ncbi:MAG: SAM-dependent methyltransferase [Gemmatimonadetes bacterium]|nr:SAM-dependent methyltransferase [Gemmatimonadota bacterium]MYD13271.1 SAM-dependent methyltransferase [Gemmatimonadota bacterium]MYI65490.1 SAM-dependent methyltransferase [Gemmatimonadota bacterium]
MSCAQCRGIEDMFGDRMARRQLRHYRRKGPGRATRVLLDAIPDASVAGGTFIDIGGGIGAIQHELIARGASRGTSADASPAYLAAARSEAEARGYADRMLYVEGDFVREANKVGAADIVTLDRVVCCYPDMPALLGASAERARRTLGLIFPRGTRFMRFGVAVVNFLQRLRRHPFRVYVHDPAEIEAVLARHGLSRSYLRDGIVWRVLVVGRDGQLLD